MQKCICQVPVAALRGESMDSAEMVSQMLFGETGTVLETLSYNWKKIKLDFDGYEGWIDAKQIILLSEEEFEKLNKKVEYFTEPIDYALQNNKPFPLVMGSEIRNFSNQIISINEQKWEYDEKIESIESSIVETAFKLINTPYLWGGKSTFGIDCSGFTQTVFKVNRYKLPRDAYQQAELGEVLSFLEEAQAGDLAFFENTEGRIIHVGIVLNNHKIIHAHGKVRVDSLDNSGIFNTEFNRHTHQLRFIKRIINQ